MGLPTAGVLCLQGSSEPHLARLAELHADGTLAAPPRAVRQRRDLDGLTHLILPGGESTTIRHLLDLFELTDELVARHRAGTLALFGTCAGAILLGQDDGTRPRRLGLLDATLARNAYGRQVDSFSAELSLELPAARGGGDDRRESASTAEPTAFHGVFIRAPRFVRIGAGVRVLATRAVEPGKERGAGAVAAPGLLAGTFHPELTRDLRIHRWFVTRPPETPPAGSRHPIGAATA